MRLPASFALALGALSSIGLVPLRAADPDLAKLQGKWQVETFEYNGQAVDLMKDALREFKEEKYTLTPKTGDAIEGTVKLLDSTKSPKHIDLDVMGRTLKGIYELDGDTLRMSYRLNGDERPTELASKPDSGVILVVHKRMK